MQSLLLQCLLVSTALGLLCHNGAPGPCPTLTQFGTSDSRCSGVGGALIQCPNNASHPLVLCNGLPGDIGPQGIPGVNGTTGQQGDIGPAGPKGDRGDVGPQGPAGATGATGPAGNTGAQGPAGATGPQGPAGATGPAGADGASSSGSSCSSNAITGTASAVFNNGTGCGTSAAIQVTPTAIVLGGSAPLPTEITGQLQLQAATNQLTLGTSNTFTVNAAAPAAPVILTIPDPKMSQVPLQLGSWTIVTLTGAITLDSTQSGTHFQLNTPSGAYTVTLPTPSTATKGINYQFRPRANFASDVTLSFGQGAAGFLVQAGTTPPISSFGTANLRTTIRFSSTPGNCDIEDSVSVWIESGWFFSAWTANACFVLA